MRFKAFILFALVIHQKKKKKKLFALVLELAIDFNIFFPCFLLITQFLGER
jgi:hypothetical protein